jgi:hypothetical protein
MGSATDGWVGGNLITFAKPAPYPTNNPVTEVDRPMLLHYTGGQWIEVNAPRSALTPAGVESQGQIGSITMFSATEGWMFAGLDSGRQALEPSTLLGPDVFRLEQGHWVQVETPTIQQRRFANMGQVVSLSPNEFWGVGTSFWWTGIPSDTGSGYAPTVTPLIVHYKDGVWSVIES